MLNIICNLFNQILSYLPCLYMPLTFTLLCHFKWPWHWLEVKRSTDSKPVGVFYLCALLNWPEWHLMLCWSSSSWMPWHHFRVGCLYGRHLAAVLLIVLKNINVGLHSDIKEPVWFSLGMMIDTSELYILIQVWISWLGYRATGV